MSYLFASVGRPSIGSQDVRVKREAASNRGAPRFRFPIEIRPNVGTPLSEADLLLAADSGHGHDSADRASKEAAG